MSKRTFEEKMEYYQKKLERIQSKYNHKRRRREDPVLSSETDSQGDEAAMHEVIELPEPEPQNLVEAGILLDQTTTQDATPTTPPLDPDILSALGEAIAQKPLWGLEIHDNLTQLWQPLLIKGMPQDTKDKFFNEYLIPSNCAPLQAPKLNAEIASAVTEMVRSRDKKVAAAQQQLGVGISAISRAITLMITSDSKLEAIRILSDACRILCDLHHNETQSRIKMITPSLAKPFLNLIQESDRDEFLFGSDLSEKIKCSKNIEKQGLQIKKSPTLTPRTNANAQPQPRRQPPGNGAGPSRYPINRGGRGGQRRNPAPARRPAAPAAATATPFQSKQMLNRPRAHIR